MSSSDGGNMIRITCATFLALTLSFATSEYLDGHRSNAFASLPIAFLFLFGYFRWR